MPCARRKNIHPANRTPSFPKMPARRLRQALLRRAVLRIKRFPRPRQTASSFPESSPAQSRQRPADPPPRSAPGIRQTARAYPPLEVRRPGGRRSHTPSPRAPSRHSVQGCTMHTVCCSCPCRSAHTRYSVLQGTPAASRIVSCRCSSRRSLSYFSYFFIRPRNARYDLVICV